jgi:nucleotide-binding universal stress UspA family protein
MMRRILLPLERCDDDAGAVTFAGALARRRRVEILLLRVEEWPVFGPFGFGWAPAWRADGLAQVKNRLEAQEGIRTQILLPEAAPSAAVLQQAQRRAASLILLPYRQERTLLRVMYGSPADRILREAPIPVLAVPGPARPINRILYLFDDGGAAIPGLRHVIDFAQLFEASVALRRVGPAASETPSIEERLLSILRRREVSARVAAGSDDPETAVSREGADLVILSRTHETGKACASLARRLLHHAPVPLLMTTEGPVPSPFIGARAPLRVGI